jgi:hypothetical protein
VSGFEEAKAEVERLQAEVEQITAQAPGGSLVPVSGSAVDAVSTKRALAEMRALAIRKQGELKEATDRMRSEIEAQLSAARAALAPVEKFVARLTEAIETVNLYLGRDEEIVTLRDGEPAPAGTPIVCRSMVLAMDEESAIDPEHGGIDARNVEAFDEWLMADEAHLNQVLPEIRGVVVIVPSKQVRDYGDPWTTRKMTEANRHSYWLIRNGERVFRMDTEFEVGYRLVPARDEFTGLFYERRYVSGGNYERVAMEPGSHAWQQAEEKQGARERHYMKVALILQGLIDRTTVFHPLPAEHVSLLKQESYDAGHVRLIDEEEFALTTGRQPFEEWLREHNAELRPGMRIVGAFNTEGWRQHRYSSESWQRGHERLSPSTAEAPGSYVVHYIEERRPDGGLVFRYARTSDDVYDERTGRWRAPKTRASCTVYADDEFIIPVDLVDEAEMLDYLQARTERHHYVEMFPLLKAAIRVKREERDAEEPFRMLLTGRLITDYDLDPADAGEAVFDLVHWWKFANKYHRPLVGDGEQEAKAVRMIVEEFGRRRRAAATDDPEMVARLKALPGVMLVARQRDGAYIALAPEHRLLDEAEFARNVYAHEWVTRPRGKTTERRWVLVSGTRAARWRILFADERWKRWNRVATAAEHLSDPEAYDGAQQAIALATDALADRDEPKSGRVARVTYSQSHKRFRVWIWPDKPIETDHYERLRVHVDVLTAWWKRGPGGAVVVESDGHLRGDTFSASFRGITWTPPWEERGKGAVVYRDDTFAAEIDAATAEVDRQQAAAEEERGRRAGLVGSVIDQWEDAEREAAYQRFLDDYADPDLWEGHLKTLRLGLSHDARNGLAHITDALLDDGQDVEGRTVGQAVEGYLDLLNRTIGDDRDRLAARVEAKVHVVTKVDGLLDCTFRAPEPEPDDDEAPDED